MNHRAKRTTCAVLAALVGGGLLVLPGCSSNGTGPGGEIRPAEAIVYGTVTADGEPASDVDVTVTPHTASCQDELLGGAEPTVATGSDGSYRVVIEREILGTSITVCPVIDFDPPAGSGLFQETVEGEDHLVELRVVEEGIGTDSVAVDVDLGIQ